MLWYWQLKYLWSLRMHIANVLETFQSNPTIVRQVFPLVPDIDRTKNVQSERLTEHNITGHLHHHNFPLVLRQYQRVQEFLQFRP